MNLLRRRRLANALLALLASGAISLSAITAASAAPPERSPAQTGETRAQTERSDGEGGRQSNALGALAGFSLLAGWLLVGLLQLWRTRRRLSETLGAGADAEASPATTRTLAAATTPAEPPPRAPSDDETPL